MLQYDKFNLILLEIASIKKTTQGSAKNYLIQVKFDGKMDLSPALARSVIHRL